MLAARRRKDFRRLSRVPAKVAAATSIGLEKLSQLAARFAFIP